MPATLLLPLRLPLQPLLIRACTEACPSFSFLLLITAASTSRPTMPSPPLHKASTNLSQRKPLAPARAYCLALGYVLNTHVSHRFGMAECRMPHGSPLHPWCRPPRAPDADTDQLLVDFECDNPDAIAWGHQQAAVAESIEHRACPSRSCNCAAPFITRDSIDRCCTSCTDLFRAPAAAMFRDAP